MPSIITTGEREVDVRGFDFERDFALATARVGRDTSPSLSGSIAEIGQLPTNLSAGISEGAGVLHLFGGPLSPVDKIAGPTIIVPTSLFVDDFAKVVSATALGGGLLASGLAPEKITDLAVVGGNTTLGWVLCSLSLLILTGLVIIERFSNKKKGPSSDKAEGPTASPEPKPTAEPKPEEETIVNIGPGRFEVNLSIPEKAFLDWVITNGQINENSNPEKGREIWRAATESVVKKYIAWAEEGGRFDWFARDLENLLLTSYLNFLLPEDLLLGAAGIFEKGGNYREAARLKMSVASMYVYPPNPSAENFESAAQLLVKAADNLKRCGELTPTSAYTDHLADRVRKTGRDWPTRIRLALAIGRILETTAPKSFLAPTFYRNVEQELPVDPKDKDRLVGSILINRAWLASLVPFTRKDHGLFVVAARLGCRFRLWDDGRDLKKHFGIDPKNVSEEDLK